MSISITIVACDSTECRQELLGLQAGVVWSQSAHTLVQHLTTLENFPQRQPACCHNFTTADSHLSEQIQPTSKLSSHSSHAHVEPISTGFVCCPLDSQVKLGAPHSKRRRQYLWSALTVAATCNTIRSTLPVMIRAPSKQVDTSRWAPTDTAIPSQTRTRRTQDHPCGCQTTARWKDERNVHSSRPQTTRQPQSTMLILSLKNQLLPRTPRQKL